MKLAKMATLLALPLVAGGVLGAATSARPVPQCVLAKAWVEAHATALPQTLSSISLQPVAFRKAILHALPVGVRISLWGEQFDAYASSPDVSREQRAFLAEAKDKVAAFLLAGEQGLKADSIPGLHEFGKRALALFGREKASMVFANIGVNTPEEVAPAASESQGNCSCNNSDMNWCGSTHFVRCLAGEPPCAGTGYGCGFLLLQECNGVCTYGVW